MAGISFRMTEKSEATETVHSSGRDDKLQKLMEKWEVEIRRLLSEDREEASLVTLECLNDLRKCCDLPEISLYDVKYPLDGKV